MTHPCVLALFSLLLASSPSLAQSPAAKVTRYVPSASASQTQDDVKPQGWDYTLTLSANFAMAQNQSVVGQPEGTSLLVGVGVNATTFYLRGPHELRVDLSLLESFSRTPVLPRLVKANDLATLEGMYSYYFLDWMGAFARLGFESPLLRTEDLRANPTDYAVTRMDGTVETLSQLDGVRLADSFEPLTLTQSLGIVANLVEQEPATVTVRAGAGSRETFAEGLLVLQDNPTTSQVELMETQNVFQGGVEGAVGLQGKLPEQRLGYGVDASALLPVLNNDSQNRSAVDLMRLALSAQLTFSMFEWLNLQYQLLLVRDRQLVEDLQVQNNLFLTFKYDVFQRKKVEDKKEDALEEARAQAAAAEARATAALDRARALEERLEALEQNTAPTPAPAPER